jgi:hypothetical protein
MELSVVASPFEPSLLPSMIHPFLYFLCHCHHVALKNVLRYCPFLNVPLVSLLAIGVSVSLLSSHQLTLRSCMESRGIGIYKHMSHVDASLARSGGKQFKCAYLTSN